ncbi:centrosomal protein of 135 kDa isoform X3 [Nasonia vitripennis]|uniref:Centrosomal protein of 135 kDa n=1 Tax=Nasonia vitripennis TaxID=7425 RepID=A0A7M7LSA9_NASVI|nr:centrosomal protein of 135 kDa isoform X3 [Nasonia vitripennis]
MNKDSDNYSIAGRYRTVRKNLDALGYKQALSLDSLPLIELLLVDLAQTKESLKHFQSIAKDNLEACSQLQLAVDPYKCDNAKLVQECNKVHLELIELKETHQKQINDYKKKIRKLESELSDLQLSFSKNLQRIKQLETESANKSKKILELQGKCCRPIVNNVNLATKKRACYPLRRPTLEAESLPRISTSTTSFSTRTVEPYVIDFVSTADHRISSLNNEVTQLKEDLFLSNEYIESLKSQLNTKDKEMSRLRKMLEGGRPCTSINKDHCCLVSEKTNGYPRHMENDDLLSLQQTKLNLEQQLKEALNKQHDAMAQAMKLAERNEELEKELKDVDRIALAVEADCNSTVKENNRRVCRLQEKLEDVMTQVHVLESELTVQRREAQELRADLEACRLEKSNVQRILESTLEEKKQMTDRINNLTIMETNLNREVDRLQKENDVQKSRITELEQVTQSLEKKSPPKAVVQKNIRAVNAKPKEKEEKAEANTRKKFIKRPIPASKSPDKHASHQEKRSEFTVHSNFKECACEKKTSDEASQCNIDKLLREKNVIIESLQNTIDKIEHERDHYKSEYMKFKDQLKKDTEKDYDGMWSQICELRAQMSEKEHAISKLLREKKECRTSPMSERLTSSTSKKIDRLEKERDAARADVERLIEERDALRERLKLATETHVSEQRRLRESLAESETRLSRIDRERRELLIAQETRRAAIHGLDDQLDDLKEELRKTKQELTEQRTQYFQLRALQDQTDEALGDVQGQLTQCENELSGALDRNKNLERQQLQLDNQIKELRQEISTHRSRMAQMDREKDQLLMDLDEKTEKIAALEREVVFKEQRASDMEQQIRELSHTKQICIDQAADLERQMRSMQLDMDNLQRQLSSATLDRESAIQENRRLQDDLAAVSCEVRSILKDLEASKAESQDLKRQLQTYVSEVRRAEELISEKENERTEMLNHFRSLSLEATVLENNNHSLESEAAEARGALQSARDQILDLQRQLSDKDCLVRGYEAQITELTQNVASLEIQLQQATEQRLCAEEDLRTVRNLCMTLEQQKECISQRLNENTDLKTQYEVQLSRYRSEQEIFQDQMNKDHVQIDRLEKLLEEARKETMDCQSNCRELQNEVSKLKKKVSELQSKLSAETAEVRKYQTQAAEYNKQITELRRQVTNERFERARMQEDSHSECQTRKEITCQTRATRVNGCPCSSIQPSVTPNPSKRYSKALVPRNQRTRASHSSNEVDEGTLSCKICVCSNNGSETIDSNRFKVHITELSSSSDGTRDGCCATNYKNNCYQEKRQQLMPSNHFTCKENLLRDAQIGGVANYQSVNRVCFCTGQTKIGDLIAKAKINKDINCKKVDIQNNLFSKDLNSKPTTSNSIGSSEASGHCGRCGGRKKQKQCARNMSPSWIAETLNLMSKLLEGKRKSVHKNEKCTDNQSTCKEIALNIVKQDKVTPSPEEKKIELSKNMLKTKQHIKYSLIETCNSNCTVSTQTLESIITISDNSRPHLLKILSEIQQYAKSIEDLFYVMNETTMQQQRNNNHEGNKEQSSNNGSTTQPVLAALASSEGEQALQDKPAELNSSVDTSIPVEFPSKHTLFGEDDFDVSKLEAVPLASTPRDSVTLLDSNAEPTEQTLNQPMRLESGQEPSEMDSMEHLSLPKEQRLILARSRESDEDSTEYLALPKVIRSGTSEDENTTQFSRSVAAYPEDVQDNELDPELEAIEEKIERLRRDVFMDAEENLHEDKNTDTDEPSPQD